MKKVKTVYDHIRANNIKTAILVVLFPIIFIALVFLGVWCVQPLNDAINTTTMVAIPTIVACVIWMLVSWAFGDSMMLNMAGAKQINDTDPDYRYVYKSVENIALAAGLPTPRVYVIEDTGLNAFATGRGPRDATVALTRGIIQKLDRLELEGVIAHEMSHIGNRDIRLSMFIITGIGVTVFIADMLARNMMYVRSDDSEKNNGAAVIMMVWLAFTIFNFAISPILRMAISRRREYAADACGAQITRNPRALADALRKISENSVIKKLDGQKTIATICIANPMRARAFMSEIFATHPPIKERIRRLEEMQSF
ncbi:MAG: M48 family metallopeptidase [Alphaproteobacteria bacterium]|nr:M48 family metallopeptidase [Alphaproteobacteria bacterium]